MCCPQPCSHDTEMELLVVHVRLGILTVCSPREGRTDSNQASGTAPGTTAPPPAHIPLQKRRCGLCCAGHFHPYLRGNIHSVRRQGCGYFTPRTRQLLEGIGVHMDLRLCFGDYNHRFPGKSHPSPVPQASLLVDRTAIPCRSSQRSRSCGSSPSLAPISRTAVCVRPR